MSTSFWGRMTLAACILSFCAGCPILRDRSSTGDISVPKQTEPPIESTEPTPTSSGLGNSDSTNGSPEKPTSTTGRKNKLDAMNEYFSGRSAVSGPN